MLNLEGFLLKVILYNIPIQNLVNMATNCTQNIIWIIHQTST